MAKYNKHTESLFSGVVGTINIRHIDDIWWCDHHYLSSFSNLRLGIQEFRNPVNIDTWIPRYTSIFSEYFENRYMIIFDISVDIYLKSHHYPTSTFSGVPINTLGHP